MADEGGEVTNNRLTWDDIPCMTWVVEEVNELGAEAVMDAMEMKGKSTPHTTSPRQI